MHRLGIVVIACLIPLSARAEQSAPDVDFSSHAHFHCGLEDPTIAESRPVPRKINRVRADFTRSAVRRQRANNARYGTVGHGDVDGALSGKTVYISAGHGLTWLDNLQTWRTQRGNTHDLVEDFISAETVSHYLIQYLRNMGAYVVPVRESDLNANQSIIDDASPAFALEGDVSTSQAPTGYGAPTLPIVDQSNPFTLGVSLEITAQSEETGRVIWTFDVPETGAYNVYVAFVQGDSRADDAHYVVRHAGGDAHFRVDQRRHGSTWVLLGRFRFEAGRSSETGALVLTNDSATPGATLSVDAARIGGGVGVIDRGGGVSGRPMFENAARYTAQMNGAPASVYDYTSSDGSDDVGTRSRFSAWDYAEGEDAVYLAWHTNAPDPARGTSSYVYAPVPPNGTLEQFTGVPGSIELMQAVHGELISDIHERWDPTWHDRGMKTAYFGEINPNHNPYMPSMLVEVAFHSTEADADYLRDPEFRKTAARSISQGIAKYFATRDGLPLTLPPEPPIALRMVQNGAGGLHLSWRAALTDPAGGDAATGYRVYLSRDGYAFDDGHDVIGESWDVSEAGTIGDQPLFARVTALNDGGESLPSPVVGGRVAPSGTAQVLIIAGFTRLDRFMLIDEDLSAFALGNIERGLVARINDESHAARHGTAIGAAGVSFDTVTADALEMGDITLTSYRAIDWFLGEQSTCCDPLSQFERTALTGYLDAGGHLLISAAELAWALVARGTADDAAYFENTFHGKYVADDAGTYGFSGAAGPFAELGTHDFADFGPGSYDAEWPDVIDPGPDAVTAFSYDTGASAGTWHEHASTGSRVLMLGFPFETIAGASNRAEIMAAILASFDIDADPLPEPDSNPDGGTGIDDPGSGCGCQTSSASSHAGFWVLFTFLLLVLRRRKAVTHPSWRSSRLHTRLPDIFSLLCIDSDQ